MAQATETLTPEQFQQKKAYKCDLNDSGKSSNLSVSYAAGVGNACLICKVEKHRLYMCPTFKSMPREKIISTLISHNFCLNCLILGHTLNSVQVTANAKNAKAIT